MLTKIAAYITRSKVAKQSLVREKHFLNWDKINKIALVIDDKEVINKSELDKFTEGLKKHIEIFFVELKSKQPTFGDWKCLSKKNKNILNLPKDFFLNEIKEKKYDLVINASLQYSVFSANLINHLNAPFKCGNNNLFGELDLIIETRESESLLSYLKEVVKYLAMIKTG